MQEDYAKEEEKITGEFGGDPLLRLKSEKLILKARKSKKRRRRSRKIDLDKMKAMMNQEQHRSKLEQNEELAGLRAGVSLAKQQWLMQVRFTILVEILKKIDINQIKEKTMVKKKQRSRQRKSCS